MLFGAKPPPSRCASPFCLRVLHWTDNIKHPDIQWRLRLDEIQESHARKMEASAALTRQDGFHVRHKSFGRPRKSAVPAVHSSHATEVSPPARPYSAAALTGM